MNRNGRGKPKGLERTGGRAPGTPNKVTADLRKGIQMFLEKKWPNIETEYDSMQDPRDKLAFILKLLEFTVPKMKSIELSTIQAQKVDALSDAEVDLLIEQITKRDE